MKDGGKIQKATMARPRAAFPTARANRFEPTMAANGIMTQPARRPTGQPKAIPESSAAAYSAS
jgi:hypothetical protein